MTELDEFENELAALIGRPTSLRPFVCDGSPLNCTAFIVGFNAATELNADFWNYWRPGYGFEKSTWFETYKQERRETPLKPGKSSRRPVSRTRAVIDIVTSAAGTVRCLETNIFSTASASAAELQLTNRNTDVFDFLIARIQPRVIVAHGADAADYIRGLRLNVMLICEPHFSRGYSNNRARELGRDVRQAIDTPLKP